MGCEKTVNPADELFGRWERHLINSDLSCADLSWFFKEDYSGIWEANLFRNDTMIFHYMRFFEYSSYIEGMVVMCFNSYIRDDGPRVEDSDTVSQKYILTGDSLIIGNLTFYRQ